MLVDRMLTGVRNTAHLSWSLKGLHVGRGVCRSALLHSLRCGARRRGFTLVELMAVVAIVGVLAVVGVMLVRKQIYSSRTVEASAMIQSIRAAQERWRAETGTYLNVSTTMTSWYPMATPGKSKYAWDQPSGNDYANWRLLNPTSTGPVQFGYTTRAGAAGTTPPNLTITNPPTFTASPEPWYLIQARGDTNADSVNAMFAATSFSPEVYSENEGE
jgi:type IV pilus assembly protein PilA